MDASVTHTISIFIMLTRFMRGYHLRLHTGTNDERFKLGSCYSGILYGLLIRQ